PGLAGCFRRSQRSPAFVFAVASEPGNEPDAQVLAEVAHEAGGKDDGYPFHGADDELQIVHDRHDTPFSPGFSTTALAAGGSPGLRSFTAHRGCGKGEKARGWLRRKGALTAGRHKRACDRRAGEIDLKRR